MRHPLYLLGGLLLALISLPGHGADYLPVPGGRFRSALPVDDKPVTVAPFLLRSQPVTNAEFQAFVSRQPQWQRGKVPSLLAGGSYLSHWTDPVRLGDIAPNIPVTHVSWFAASAFCESEGARLPRWHEWELAAAADAQRADARQDPAWRARILRWYERPATGSLPPVGRDANLWGITDLHGAIYEWVEDFNGLFVTVDSRSQGEQKTLETCGAAALSLDDRENYAILMRIAMLSALAGRDTLSTLGFRCARDVPATPPAAAPIKRETS